MNTAQEQVTADGTALEAAAAAMENAAIDLDAANETLKADLSREEYAKVHPSLAKVSGVLTTAAPATSTAAASATTWVADNPVPVTPPAPPPVTATVPSAPVSLSATAGNGEATLTWKPPTNDGGAAITGYNGYAGSAVVVFSTDETSSTVENLTNGTAYTFEVAAVNSAGIGALSGGVTVTPTTSVVPPVPPNGTPVPMMPQYANLVLAASGDFEFASLPSKSGNPAGWDTSYSNQGGSSIESAGNVAIVNDTGLILTQSSSGVGDCITTSSANGASPGFACAMPFYREVEATSPVLGGANVNHVGSWLLSGFSDTIFEVDMIESLNNGSGTGSIWCHLHAGPTSNYQQSDGINLGVLTGSHKVGAYVATSGVTFYLDGKEVGTQNWPTTPPAGTTMFALHQTDDTPSYGGPSDPGAVYTVAYDRFFVAA